MKSYELVVIGGGVSGLWSAYLAAMRGKSVALIERRALGSGGTGSSAGIITTQLILKHDIELAKRSLQYYYRVAQELDFDNFFNKCGFLSVEPRWMAHESSKTLSELNVPHEILEGYELRDVLGSWVVIDEGEVGIYTEHDGTIDTGLMTSSLRILFNELNVEIREFSPLTSLIKNGEELSRAVLKGGEVISAEDFVFAAGPWNKVILDEMLMYELPTTTYSCQALSLIKPSSTSLKPTYFTDSHLYVRPEGDSRLIVGNGYATLLRSPEECINVADRAFVEEISEKISRRFKDPESIMINKSWAGPCSSTPDGLPLVGRLDGLENAYIIDGLNGYGLMRAPALAELLTDLISGGSTFMDVSVFDPSRFTGKDYSLERVMELHS